MLKNHIIFAIRLFLKERIYSVLNVLGLTLGITVGIILLLYLQNELNYDQHFIKYEQIYRYTNHLKAQGADFNTARSSRRLGPIFKQDLPEVMEYVRFLKGEESLVSSTDNNGINQFYEDQVWLTDSTVFKLFDHTFYEGNPKTCLVGPGKVVLTQSVAKKYFGNAPALGKRLKFDDDTREVTAVISDLPENSHLKYDILLSNIPLIDWDKDAEAERTSEVYWNPSCYTYLLLPADYDTQKFYNKFSDIHDKTFALFGKRIEGTVDPELQRIDRIHFDSDKGGDEPTGNLSYVYTFAAVGFFIILLACINYMNMATARSVTRTGEMGIRKVLGYSRTALFGSVMIEALLMAFVALVLANVFTFSILELTPFNELIHKNLALNYLSNPTLIAGMISITVVIGFISGIYPALYIPSVPVVTALKGTFTGDRVGAFLRKSLITFQFAISLFVIICTVLMDEQIEYMQNKDLGFNKDQVVLINVQDTVVENRTHAITNELLKNPNIIGTTNSYGVPGRGVGGPVMMIEKDSGMVQQHLNSLYVGKGFLDLMEIEIVDGRSFRENSEADFYKSFLINESGAKELGWGDDAIGKKVRHFHGKEDYHIVGVYKDFHYESLHSKINPLFLVLDSDLGGTFYIKIKSNDMRATLDYIESVWTMFDTKHPFEYMFMDEEFARQYEADLTQKTLISILSYVCIFVSLLGLIGLSAFTASRKAKEISIRKVLGAKNLAIIMLFSKDYVRLILIAFVISVPLADYAIVEWMSGFAYRMDINWLYFIVPGFTVLTLGLLTVSIQSLRSARANPVDGLRSE
ncbi:MAG: ABC transporter permease [Cyclobacteriaceae bacterium]